MHHFSIVTDSSCDLPQALVEQYHITVAQLDVTTADGKTQPDSALDRHVFYEYLRKGGSASTASVSIGKFTDLFEDVLKEGNDLLYIGFSSGLSATCKGGETAADDLRARYPDRTILTVDTLAASLGQGLLVYHAARMREAGADICEVASWLEENKLHMCHWFTVEDLFFLKRGGRINAATAIVGSMLAFKPIMHMDDAGHLINVSKARGRRAALTELCNRMEKSAINPAEQTVFISHGDCEEDAKFLADMVKERLGVKEVMIGCVGPVIGAHSGPGTMALFYLGTER